MQKNSRTTGVKKPTPYMEGLRFTPWPDGAAADPDVRVLWDEELAAAIEEGTLALQSLTSRAT